MGVLNRLYLFAFGYFRIAVEERQRACLLNLFVKEKIMGYPDEGGFVVAARYRKRLLRALACQGINVSVTDVCGLPAYFRKHHKRIGLLLGACGVVLMMIASRSVVWRVEVSGNEIITKEEIEADLAQIGFGVGSLIKAADFQELSAALRLRHTEIAHADIYCIGTVAHVRVREADIPRTEEKDTSPMHLVADYDAVITGFDVRHGTVAVKEGQVIKKGELLVSGIVNGVHGDTLLHAEGEVYGCVTEEIVVEIPLEQRKYSVLDTQNTKITVFFFGKAINIQKNAGNLPTTYGTIVEEERWTLPGGISLPITYAVEKAILYKAENVTLSYEQALRLALAKLKGKLEVVLADGQLVSKSTTAEASSDGCIIKCTVTYIKCISKEQPIFVGE